MTQFKIWVSFCLFWAIIVQTSSTFLSVKNSIALQKQQKYPTTIQSRRLYLSKSLSSREELRLPFQRIFSISSSFSSSLSSNSIINFSPTTVKLSSSKHSTFIQFDNKTQKSSKSFFGKQILRPSLNSINQSILNDLRTPFPVEISQIVILNQNFIFVFVFPAKVLVLQEMENTLAIKNTYQVEQLLVKFGQQKQSNSDKTILSPESLNFYPLAESYVIGILQESNEFFLFDNKGYAALKNQASINKLEHIHCFDTKNMQFFTAQRENGFKHCRINLTSHKIQLIHKYERIEDIGLNLTNQSSGSSDSLEIYDISFSPDSNQIYLLDINLGVIKFRYEYITEKDKVEGGNSYSIVPNTTSILIKQRGCQALDYIHNDRIVLICQERKRRFFVEAYFNASLNTFDKQPPVFHNCNFDDLQITPEYYIAFERSSIDIFWPSRNNFIPELVHNKKHINLLGMQAFKIHVDKSGKVFLFSVRNNILIKEKLQEQQYSLSVGSNNPLRKSFTIQAFGSCQSLYFNLNDHQKKYSMRFDENQVNLLNQKVTQNFKNKKGQPQMCKIRIPIELQTSRYIFQNRGKFSLAIGILVICALIAFTLACICTKKYIGMEKTAQETLYKLKTGAKINPQFVL